MMLLEHYLDGAVEVPVSAGRTKWQFICTFCGPLNSQDCKRWQKKGALLWNSTQHSWVFCCAKKGSVVFADNEVVRLATSSLTG